MQRNNDMEAARYQLKRAGIVGEKLADAMHQQFGGDRRRFGGRTIKSDGSEVPAGQARKLDSSWQLECPPPSPPPEAPALAGASWESWDSFLRRTGQDQLSIAEAIEASYRRLG